MTKPRDYEEALGQVIWERRKNKEISRIEIAQENQRVDWHIQILHVEPAQPRRHKG